MKKNLKPVPKGNKGLGKLPKPVRNKMGYMKQGGEKMLVKMMNGGRMDMVDEIEMKMRMGGERMRPSYKYGGSMKPKKSMQKYKMGGWTYSGK